MWQYRSTEELYHSDDYLMHYGVLGMKWRVHKANKLIKKMEKMRNRTKDNVDSLKALTRGYADMHARAMGTKNKNVLKREAERQERKDKIDGYSAKGALLGALASGAVSGASLALAKKKGEKIDAKTAIRSMIAGTGTGLSLGAGIGNAYGRNKVYKNNKKAKAYDYGAREPYSERYDDGDYVDTEWQTKRLANRYVKTINRQTKKLKKLKEKAEKFK